jgi:hypothetical protein
MNHATRVRSFVPGFGVLVVALLARPSAGQLTPVVGRGATAFDPEISVVNSGVLADAQAVVSHDRRYVTITMGASQSNLIALRPFPVQAVAGNGFVGNANPGGNAPRDGGRPGAARAEPTGGDDAGAYPAGAFAVRLDPTPAELSDPQILDRRGMIRLSPR